MVASVKGLIGLHATTDIAQDLVAGPLPNVVTIRLNNVRAEETGLGSGFWIGDGDIATNAHVVAPETWAEGILESVCGQ